LGINTGGWFRGGISMNGEDPGDNINGPLLLNDRHGEFQAHQLWFYFDRPCDTGGCGFDIGGRVDIFYGTDWRVALAHGLGFEDNINGPDQYYGFSVPQFYTELAVNDFSVKLGRMAGILGYEGPPAPANFFYSHAYTVCYSEPVLITGLMAQYKLSDRLVALAGSHMGFNRFDDDNSELNFQGGFKWTSCDSLTSLAFSVDVGRNDPAGLQDQYVHSLVFKHQLATPLSYVFQSNLGITNGGAPGGADAEWYSVNQYLFYELNERWSAGLRTELFRDDDGMRVGGLGRYFPSPGWMSPGGYAGTFYELTVGLNWKPKANITFRPEIRWDRYAGPASFVPGSTFPLPYDGGNSRERIMFAADLVVTF